VSTASAQCKKNAEKAGDNFSNEYSGDPVRIRWTDVHGSPCEFPLWVMPLFPAGEIDRIGRFVREPDRRLRYAALALLFHLIHETFGDCSAMHIDYDPQGKPYLSGAGNADISVSHSGDVVVCALSAQCRIGIDIEKVRPVEISEFRNVFPESLMKWCLSDPGVSYDSNSTDNRFFRAWTRFESVIKADGQGLGAPFDDLVFDGDSASLNNKIWHLKALEVTEGYTCNLASNEHVEKCEVLRVGGLMPDHY